MFHHLIFLFLLTQDTITSEHFLTIWCVRCELAVTIAIWKRTFLHLTRSLVTCFTEVGCVETKEESWIAAEHAFVDHSCFTMFFAGSAHQLSVASHALMRALINILIFTLTKSLSAVFVSCVIRLVTFVTEVKYEEIMRVFLRLSEIFIANFFCLFCI